MRLLTIQTFIFYFIYSDEKKVFCKIIQHMLFKGYFLYKTIFCLKGALDVSFMNFLFEEKNALFSRYLNFCIFVKCTDFKIHDIILGFAE